MQAGNLGDLTMKLSDLPIGAHYTYPEGAEDAGELFIVREQNGDRALVDAPIEGWAFVPCKTVPNDEEVIRLT